MPTYEYKCTRCGKITSEFKPMSAPRRRRCPDCRCKVDLLISGGLGIVFKGEGFYVNDSRKAARSGSRPDGGTSEGAKPEGAKPEGARPEGGKPGAAEAESRPRPDNAGGKPVAPRDGKAHDSKRTDKARD